MDYEQKYNKLVNAIKVLQETNPSDEGIQNWVNDNVPELRESEDEMIRGAIIDHLKDYNLTEWADWLEKQKPEVNVVKFKPGNKVTNGISIYTIDSIEGDYYRTKDGVNIPFNLEYRWKIVENEQKPVEWEQDNIEDLTDFEKAFQGMCCDKNKQFAKECCKTLLELAKKQLQEKCDKQCCSEVNDIAMQQQLQIWFDKGKCSGRDEVIFHPETYGLQKQGEQKPADKVEPKLHIGDWVVDEDDNNIYQIERVIENVTSGNFSYDLVGGGYFPSTKKNYHIWTIQDAKEGDVLTNDEVTFIFNWTEITNEGWYVFHYHIGYSCRNTKIHLGDIHGPCSPIYTHPATKEQRDLLFQKMQESGYEWDAENKELNKIEDEEYNGEDYGIDSLYHAQRILEKTLGKVNGYQTDDGILSHQCAITAVKKLYEQKPAEWSEKDEHWRQKAIDFMEHPDLIKATPTLAKDTINWLKSIKQRHIWKPSREQMIALRQAISGCSYNIEPLLELETKLKEF